MATRVILEFDARNTGAISIIEMLQNVGFFKVTYEETGMKATNNAIRELKQGKVKRHSSVDSLMKDLMTD
jgi:hypothetical protein